MTRLTGHCTVSWQYIRVDTVGSAPEVSNGILVWTMLFINIFTVYVLESEVANFVPPPTLHHLTTAVTLIII